MGAGVTADDTMIAETDLGVAIPDIFAELMKIWDGDNHDYELILSGKTRRWMRDKQIVRLSFRARRPVPGNPTEATVLWIVDRWCRVTDAVVEGPGFASNRVNWSRLPHEFKPKDRVTINLRLWVNA